MMKKIFLQLSALLFVLMMGVNAAWAIHFNPEQGALTPEQAETMGYWAKLTAKPAATTNGSGKVFVVADYKYSEDPAAGDYVTQSSDEDWSDIFLASSLINSDVEFRIYAKADDGSYFTGWSFTDGYTDLGTNGNYWVKVTPSATAGRTNKREHVIFAAFLPVQLVSYQMVSGSQEVTDDGAGNWKCTQTIKFRAETPGFWALSSVGDERHFKRPVIEKKAGTTGTWAIDDAAWISSGVGQNVWFSGNYAELAVPVTFTAPNGDVNDYAATLTLETYAGVKMKVYLSARTTGGDYEAVRYNKSKVQYEGEEGSGTLENMLTKAVTGDIIKLNGGYNDAVVLNKNITFDLNGYTLGNTLTVSGGNVTLAYSPYGGTISGDVAVTGGKLALNGGTISGEVTVNTGATLEQNGAKITGAVTNAGTMTTTDGSITGQLASSGRLTLNGGTFTNNSGIAVNITGGTADIKRGTISGSTYGVQTTAGSATIGKLAAVTSSTKALNGAGGSLTVNNGKFTDPANLIAGTVTFNAGYFQSNNAGGSTALGKQVWRNTAGAEFRDGYAYFVGDQEAAQASNVSVCRIGHTSYNSLDEALAYANNSGEEVIIIMENDYTLKAGYYTLPANATLVVPMSNDQETANPVVPRLTSGTPAPVCFRKLIFENGVNMEVAGTIEVTCTQYGSGETMGIPGGNYGHLIMKPGSHMTINNGGYLRAWGFVTGDGTKDGAGNYLSGEIDVRRGGTVHEMFQMGDWKGGDISFTIAMEVPGMTNWRDMAHLFPIYTYFIQNVESPVKYHPGASLICATSVNVSGSINAYANDIKVVGKVGEPAMFLMDEKADAENTWVRKYYDAKKDQQVYEVNSGAQLGSMVINLGEVPGSFFGASGTLNLVLDSRKFVLPLTNNFKIHLLSGYMQFTQSTSCLPGMEVEIDKESEVSIIKNDNETIVSGGLYFYDADQWSFQNNQTYGYVGNSGKFGAIVRYSPTWDLGTNGATKQPDVRDISSPAKIGDAILNVHGTFRMGEGCAVYTTWAKDNTLMALDESEGATGGASVISNNEDAGTFIFDADAPAFDGIQMSGMNITGFGPNVIVNYDHNDYGITSPMAYPVKIPTVLNQSTPTPVFGIELSTSAKLKNGDGTFTETSGTPAGTSYCYMDGKWTTMQLAEDPCFMKEIVGGQTTYYAKPQEYVAVAATWDGSKMVGNADHTFSDAAGAGRLFILMKDDCQWWEVEKKDNLYHCIHPNNDTYYYWDETESKWMEQRFTITWLNWDGEEIKSYVQDGSDMVEVDYSVTYGTQAEYLGSNPTREPDIDYTYNFTGWTPALGPVKSNVTYTATYVQQPRKYTIIFTEEGGKEIERQFLLHNDVPVCENVPTRTGFTLQWEPEVAAVTGDATYRATWLENPPTKYQVTFYDYDGTTVLQQSNVSVGAMPVYEGETPTGKATWAASEGNKEYTYVFDHWSPEIEKVTATSIKSYTAVYAESPLEYTITFKNEDNSVRETQKYHYGETPVCSNLPTKAATAQYTYTLRWNPQIQTVMADATYKAVFDATTNKYTVTLKSDPASACTFTGAGTFNYGPSVNNVAVSYDSEAYEFLGWADLTGAAKTATTHSTFTLTGDITIVANFRYKRDDKVTITWKNWDGSVLGTSEPKVNAATTYTGATPTKPAEAAYTYTFDGWTDSQSNFYKNNQTPKATADATYIAHFTAVPVPDLTISNNNGAPTVLSQPVQYHDLVITSNGATYSGQLVGSNYLTLTGNAHFDLAINAQNHTWYAIAVPWQVDPTSGISVNGRVLTFGTDFDILYYDGAERAAGNVAWKYLELKEGDKTIQPGTLYMIGLMMDAPVIRFTKKNGAPLLTTGTSVTTYASSEATDANWNGIANPALFAAYVNAGATLGQVYNNDGSDSYSTINLSTAKLILGQPVFVQAPTYKAITVSYGGAYAAAPRRAKAAETSEYELRISTYGAKYTDRLFVQADEAKEHDVYTIGKDLAKMGVSARVAQMWINRYDTKLCMNTFAPINGVAEYPLGIYTPKNGEYRLSLATMPDSETSIYLTYDGEAIWNLANGAYAVDLEKGTDNHYGIRVTVKNAPQTTTGIDEAIVDAKGETRKVLINDQVFIIRGDKVYSIDGQLVK